MRKIARTLTALLIWLVMQLLGGIPYSVGLSMNAMGKAVDTVGLLAIGLLGSQILELLVLWKIRFFELRDTVRPFPGWKILLISLPLGFSVLYGVQILATPFDVPDFMSDEIAAMCHSVVGVLAVAIVGPISEEVLMRRIILREMETATGSTWGGILISAAIFAIIHLNPAQVVFAFPAGVLLGWLYCRTGSLLVPICVHILNNSCSVIFTLLGVDEESVCLPETQALIQLAVCAAVAVSFITLMNRRCPKEKRISDSL